MNRYYVAEISPNVAGYSRRLGLSHNTEMAWTKIGMVFNISVTVSVAPHTVYPTHIHSSSNSMCKAEIQVTGT